MVTNLPPRNRNFAGRGDLLEQLHNDLRAAAAAAVVPTEAVHGLGGIGKTELVTEYAHRFGSDYDLTWWIPAQEPATSRLYARRGAKRTSSTCSHGCLGATPGASS